MPFALPLYTKTALKRMELADLALQHRQGIAEIRHVPYVQAWSKHVEAVGRPCLPSRRLGHDSWTSSNQVVGHSTDIFFGVPTSQFFCLFAPLVPDHLILLNQVSYVAWLFFITHMRIAERRVYHASNAEAQPLARYRQRTERAP